MAILKHLETLRAALPAIETVAYMDLRSSTVLAKSAALDIPQERLDALCALGSDLLGGAGGETDKAALVRATEVLVMCRASGSATEALCLVCAPDADISRVLNKAREALEEAA